VIKRLVVRRMRLVHARTSDLMILVVKHRDLARLLRQLHGIVRDAYLSATLGRVSPPPSMAWAAGRRIRVAMAELDRKG
jgi:hypothetical protein